jgi:hypothetical protein
MLLLVLLSLLGIPFEYEHRASNSNLTSTLTGARPVNFAKLGARARVRVRRAVRSESVCDGANHMRAQ